METRQYIRAAAMATISLALAVQSVLAIGDLPPEGATPEATEPRRSVDPGFVVRAGENIDPGFIAVVEDQSNDTGFIVIPGTPRHSTPSPPPSPTPGSATPPAITLGAR